MSEQGGLPMLPWYPGDFMKKTRGWPLLARGLYRELLDAQWDMGPLPSDPEELATIAGAKPEEFAAAWSRVRSKFVDTGDGRLVNLKLEEHRATSLQLRDDKSRAGRIGGLASAAARSKGQATDQAKGEAKDQATVQAGVAATVQATVQRLPQALVQADVNPPSPSPSPSQEGSSLNLNSPLNLTTSGAQKIPRADDEVKKQSVEVRGTRIPLPFFVTDDMRAWAQAEAPAVDLRRATAEFEDYWRAVPGAKGRKTDWLSTWRNRMREQQARAAQSGKRTGNDAPQTKHGRMTEALRNG